MIAQRGTVQAFGQDIAAVDAAGMQSLRKRMGVLFQQGALFTDLNVFENVAFPLREHTRLSEAELTERVLDKLDAVGARRCPPEGRRGIRRHGAPGRAGTRRGAGARANPV